MGDRIVIHGLKQAQHLNGRHGFIGGEPDEQTGRLPVDFDLVDPSVGRVMVQPANLKREVTIMDDGRQLVGKESGSSSSQAKSDTKICVDPLHKSGVENGILVEEEGRPLSLILDAIRFMAGSVLFQDPNIQTGLQDVEQLRNQGPRGLLKINQFMGAAWTHWNDKGPYDTPGNKTMYELLLQFFEELPSANGCNMSDMPLEFRKAKEALHHLTAVRGWRVRIHGGKQNQCVVMKTKPHAELLDIDSNLLYAFNPYYVCRLLDRRRRQN